MLSLRTTMILGMTSALFMAAPALAEKVPEKEMVISETENTQVLGAIETADLIPVEDDSGNVFFNRYVTQDELFDTSIDHEVVDTVTIEHNGRVYTNIIVTE